MGEAVGGKNFHGAHDLKFLSLIPRSVIIKDLFLTVSYRLGASVWKENWLEKKWKMSCKHGKLECSDQLFSRKS